MLTKCQLAARNRNAEEADSCDRDVKGPRVEIHIPREAVKSFFPKFCFCGLYFSKYFMFFVDSFKV